MKRAFTVTGAAFVIAVLLSSPVFAQTSQPPAEAKPAPAPEAVEIAEPSIDIPMDELIAMASTPEDRRRLMMRCAGPPPKHMPVAESPKPAVEPAISVASVEPH